MRLILRKLYFLGAQLQFRLKDGGVFNTNARNTIIRDAAKELCTVTNENLKEILGSVLAHEALVRYSF